MNVRDFLTTLFRSVPAFLLIFASGCGHNTGSFTIGTRLNAGVDPQNLCASVSYSDGLNIVEVSRENASWELAVDSDNGFTVEKSTGTVRGVKRIRREIGPQMTGYFTKLAEKDPAMARHYLEAVKYYWKYRASERAAAASEKTDAAPEKASAAPEKTDDIPPATPGG